MTEPEVVGVCKRFSNVRPQDIITGTVFTEYCAQCGERICTAPSTLELVRKTSRDKVQLICLECYLAAPRQGDFIITPAATLELLNHKPKRDEVQ